MSAPVIINRAVLASALKLLKDTVRTGSVDILETVKIEAAGPQQLAITATNTERQMRVLVGCEAGDLQPVCVNHSRLDAAVDGLFGADIQIKSEDGHLLLSAKNGGRRKLPTLPASTFPAMTPGGFDHRFEIDADALGDALGFVQPAMLSEDSATPHLCGVCVSGSGGVLTFVALDGKRLHEHCIADFPLDLPAAIWPDKVIGSARAILARVDGPVTVELSASIVQITAGNVTLLSKLIDGKFPDHRRIIASAEAAANARLSGHGAELSRALDAVSRLAEQSKQYGRVIEMRVGPEHCDVRCRGMAECEEPIDGIEFEGKGERRIGVTAAQLAAAIRAFGEVPISAILNDNKTPILLTAPDQAHRRAVVMPVQI